MIAESMEKPEAPEADKRLPQQAEQDQVCPALLVGSCALRLPYSASIP